MDLGALVADVARSSGLSLARGKVTIPTPRLVEIARTAAAKAKMVRSIDLVPADGEVRVHLTLEMMGDTTRIVVRAAVAAFHLASSGGALRLRLLEAPTFAGTSRKSGGLLGMLGAFGGAALTSMGPEGIAGTLAEFLGPPLSARGDLLSVDLGSVPAVRALLERPTPLGRIGDLVHVVGARFRPGGLELSLALRPRSMVRAFASSLADRLLRPRLPPGPPRASR
ncbi:MAG: hypothetical protein NVS3B10_02420 [Polyangiales bacterium]